MNLETLRSLAEGMFVAGDQYFVCNSGCDVDLNDLIVLDVDETGVSKDYWRVISKLKTLATFKNVRGYGMSFWLVRREVRDD